MNYLLKYYHTIKHLKFIQVYYRVLRKYSRKSHPKKIASELYIPKRTMVSPFKTPILKNSKMTKKYSFKALNHEQSIDCADIWNDVRPEKLWLYHLHYFDELNSVNSPFNFADQQAFLHRWINENPIGTGIGWEPYPLSLRIVNWIKWLIRTDISDQKILASLILQTEYLTKKIEYHLLANHLLANAKALIFAGLYFEQDPWFEKGWNIVKQQLPEQILADGAHFERSPMYHGIILEDMLDLINIMTAYDNPNRNFLFDYVYRMFYWLLGMSHENKEPVFFNDTTTCAFIPIDRLMNYAQDLQVSFPTTLNQDALISFPNSGYYRMHQGDALLIVDAGKISPDYNPGHAHAQTFSFEFSLAMKRILVNSGISTYEHSTQRLQQRGTAAHNTVTVADQNSSEVWHRFRVGRRAKIHNLMVDSERNIIQATHSGYAKLKVWHTRQWQLQQQHLCIVDQIDGSQTQVVKIYYHLHPDVSVEIIDPSTIKLLTADNMLEMNFSSGHVLLLQVIDSFYHPEFGLNVNNKTIVCQASVPLPLKVMTNIHWN